MQRYNTRNAMYVCMYLFGNFYMYQRHEMKFKMVTQKSVSDFMFLKG